MIFICLDKKGSTDVSAMNPFEVRNYALNCKCIESSLAHVIAHMQSQNEVLLKKVYIAWAVSVKRCTQWLLERAR
jgi:hypothetical protein